VSERPTCRRCGSTKLRRSHSHTGLQKTVRRFTALDRYACGDCGFRGWTWGKVEVPEDSREKLKVPPAAPVGPDGKPAGRRLEKRDHRLRRRLRIRTFATVGVAVLLGVLAALYLQRCGGGGEVSPPP
jgi:hypothetical protein